MIRYNKTVSINTNTSTGQVQLKTDRGQVWETSKVNSKETPWTDWWDKQHHSDLREWQKDAFLKVMYDCYQTINWANNIELYLVYQKGGGFQQAHDIALAHIPNEQIWLLSTNDHTWIHKSNFAQVDLSIDNALSGITEQQVRFEIYELTDALKKQVMIAE